MFHVTLKFEKIKLATTFLKLRKCCCILNIKGRFLRQMNLDSTDPM